MSAALIENASPDSNSSLIVPPLSPKAQGDWVLNCANSDVKTLS